MVGRFVGTCFLLLIGLLGVYQAKLLPQGKLTNPGPGFFPYWISLILCCLSIFSVVSIVRRGSHWRMSIQWPCRSAWLRIVLSLLLFAGYAVMLELLGYVLSTILLIGILAKVIFKRSWLVSGFFTILAVFGSYAVLVWVLGIRLPVPQW